MKKLFKATYHSVIYSEQNQAAAIADMIVDDGLQSLYGLEEIKELDALPPRWSEMCYAIVSDEGEISEEPIRELLNSTSRCSAVAEEIKALKQRLAELEEKL